MTIELGEVTIVTAGNVTNLRCYPLLWQTPATHDAYPQPILCVEEHADHTFTITGDSALIAAHIDSVMPALVEHGIRSAGDVSIWQVCGDTFEGILHEQADPLIVALESAVRGTRGITNDRIESI